jgi:hypothetical protein
MHCKAGGAHQANSTSSLKYQRYIDWKIKRETKIYAHTQQVKPRDSKTPD